MLLSCAVVCAVAMLAATLTTLLLGYLAYRAALQHTARVEAAARPPISVLKPLTGLDEGLYENLEAFAQLDYPRFELIFVTHDAADPACALVRRLAAAYPTCDVKLVVATSRCGLNPKVNNLHVAAQHATYDHLLVSDANVRPTHNYLTALAAQLDAPDVGLVSNLLGGGAAQSVGATFEDLHLCSFVLVGVCASTFVRRRACVVGKSMLMRRDALRRAGGFYGVRDVLAEDYVLGQRFEAAGFAVRLSPHVLQVVHVRRPVSAFAERHLRWAQMRARLEPWAYAGEWLLNPSVFAWGLLLLSCQARCPSWASLLGLGGMLVKIAIDRQLYQTLCRRRLPAILWLCIPAKDLLVAFLWLVGMLKSTTCWRGNRLRIGRGSILSMPCSDADGLPEALSHAP